MIQKSLFLLAFTSALLHPAFAEDTGPVDTGSGETTDTGLQHYGDTGPVVPTYGAAELAGDEGGCGCAQTEGAALSGVVGLLLAMAMLRRRTA